ncbi:hypothetical protein FNV43_RR21647 [Rhamnella rubrinervis]|uniref:RING-type domain-containing protein n=1 Tax=Rhamnella rubrinervis TaxID=2594499 RepID=A0A8K0GME5_9ROSA|nr:hypothetical protein FNV43_RR21647 [Rhamnella rubrinervis]
MEIGQEAIFTGECSLSFHFNCIVSNVEHGNNFCPICCSKRKSLPFKAPTIDDSELNEVLLAACRHPSPPLAPTPSASYYSRFSLSFQLFLRPNHRGHRPRSSESLD